MPRPFTAMQQGFVDNFRGDATKAARAAGYKGSKKSLKVMGSKLLANPRIRAAIDAKRGPPPAAPSSSSTVSGDPEDILRAIANDPVAHPSARLKAADTLRRIKRERDLENPPKRDPFELDRPTTPAVWVPNDRGPWPP